MTDKPQFVGEKAAIGTCFSYIKNGANIKQDKGKAGIPITRIETLSGGCFNRSRMGYADIYDLSSFEDRILQDKDILMSHINSMPYLGRAVMYEALPGERIIHGMNLLCLRTRDDLLPKYAELYFNTTLFRKQIFSIAKNR